MSKRKYTTLSASHIIKTQQLLTKRITARFPDSGLRAVSEELMDIAEAAAQTATTIRQKALGLRIGIGLILVFALVLLVTLITSVRARGNLSDALNFAQFAEAVLASTVFVGAAVLFLFSIETRLKRRRALSALHELRAFGHVVDMHQLAKDPEGILKRQPKISEVKDSTTHSLFELNRYLSYCTELLAIVSKIAAVYVQDFPDNTTVSAVEQVESLCARLAQKIWQKISIVERLMDEEKEREQKRDGVIEQPAPTPGV